MSSNNYNDNNHHRHGRHNNNNNQETNYSHRHNKQSLLQQSLDYVDNDDNRDYLLENQIFNWFANQSTTGKFMIHDCVTYTYVIVLASIYDQWIRTDYKRKLWRVYLKLAQERYYQPAEVLQCTNELDDDTNTKFIQDELRRLDDQMSTIIKGFDECGSVLFDYRKNYHHYSVTTSMLLAIGGLSTSGGNFQYKQIDHCIDELNDHVINYVMYYTRHYRKFIDTKIRLAKAQATYS